MAWYSDEQYSMIQDSREKKSIAASAFKQRTHCGKCGGVRLPSDFMSKKELKAMNGECVSYRMNEPISWGEFKTWPEEHQKSYIANLREKFKVPNTALAEAFGIDKSTISQYTRCLGLGQGKETGAAGRYWHDTGDSIKFWAWWNGKDVSETNEMPDLRKPMSWGQFKSMSSELKVAYIQWIRDYFNAPDKYIGEMLFRVSGPAIRRQFTELGLCKGKNCGDSKKTWEKESFLAWCTGVDIKESKELVSGEAEIEVEETMEETFDDGVEPMIMPEISEDYICPDVPAKSEYPGPIAFTGNQIPVIPKSGSMTFENNRAEYILTTLKTLLGDIRVSMTVSWEVVSEDGIRER